MQQTSRAQLSIIQNNWYIYINLFKFNKVSTKYHTSFSKINFIYI